MVIRLIFIIIAIGMGWSLSRYLYNIELSPKKEVYTYVSKSISFVSPVSKSKKEHIVKEENNLTHRFFLLLKEDNFDNILSFYFELDANNTLTYQNKIKNYLELLSKKNKEKALEYMHIFLENVPQSNIINSMIEIYIETEAYDKAIKLIMDLKENYVSEVEDKRLKQKLRATVKSYIDQCISQGDYVLLIDFLEEMIAYDSTDSFYTFQLAKLYMHLEKTEKVKELFEELKDDEIYAQKINTYIKMIDKKENDNRYKYTIALVKYGEHFAIDVLIDENKFRLMLDTGATYIFIDEDKASMLEVINSDLQLQTASETISAKLCKATQLQIGELYLEDIKITVAPFKREKIDGLLGMNFFSKFTFFIDQDTATLYLNPKE